LVLVATSGEIIVEENVRFCIDSGVVDAVTGDAICGDATTLLSLATRADTCVTRNFLLAVPAVPDAVVFSIASSSSSSSSFRFRLPASLSPASLSPASLSPAAISMVAPISLLVTCCSTFPANPTRTFGVSFLSVVSKAARRGSVTALIVMSVEATCKGDVMSLLQLTSTGYIDRGTTRFGRFVAEFTPALRPLGNISTGASLSATHDVAACGVFDRVGVRDSLSTRTFSDDDGVGNGDGGDVSVTVDTLAWELLSAFLFLTERSALSIAGDVSSEAIRFAATIPVVGTTTRREFSASNGAESDDNDDGDGGCFVTVPAFLEAAATEAAVVATAVFTIGLTSDAAEVETEDGDVGKDSEALVSLDGGWGSNSKTFVESGV
jgi:hypothetical protein